VLEINPRHPAIVALTKAAESAETEDGAFMLLDLARIADGEAPIDAAAFAKRLTARLAKDGA
jgi:molecular chaperone HtpG